MIKRSSKKGILNTLHAGFVYTCMAVTLYSVAHLSYAAYNYFAVIKPARKIERIRLEKELLEETQIRDGIITLTE